MEKNPKLNIIFAHFMFLSNQIEVAKRLVETYPNLKFDLTPGWEMYVGFSKNYEKWRDFFETYSDRIYYVTDSNSYPIKRELHETIRYAVGGEAKEIDIPHATFARMRGFDLSKEAQENICYRNYKRTIGTPRSVDTELLLSEAQGMITLFKNNHTEQEAVERLEKICSVLRKNASI